MPTYEHYQTTKGSETLHPIPVPVKAWSQIGIDLFGPLKEIDGHRYIVTAVDYTSKSVGTELLKDKTGEAVAKFLYKFCADMDQVKFILQTKAGSWWAVLMKNFTVLQTCSTV